MRIAVISDIHGTCRLWRRSCASRRRSTSWSGGDVAAGPMPAETLDALARLDARCVMGNADRLMAAAFDAGAHPSELEDPIARLDAWCAQRITREHRDALGAYMPTVSLDGILFCHGSPRSDEEIITAVSPDERLGPMFDGVAERTIVCAATPTTSSTTCSAALAQRGSASACPTRTRPPPTGCCSTTASRRCAGRLRHRRRRRPVAGHGLPRHRRAHAPREPARADRQHGRSPAFRGNARVPRGLIKTWTNPSLRCSPGSSRSSSW